MNINKCNAGDIPFWQPVIHLLTCGMWTHFIGVYLVYHLSFSLSHLRN